MQNPAAVDLVSPELHPPLPAPAYVPVESASGIVERHRAVGRLRRSVRAVVASRRGLPAWVLLVSLFIGVGWLRAAVEKLIDPLWWNGTVLGDFVAIHSRSTLPWFGGYLETIVAPNPLVIAIVVVAAQLAAAATLLVGRYMVPGLLVGMFLNLNFVAAGAVNPSIFYLVCQAALLLWMVQYHTTQAVATRTMRWISAASLALCIVSAPFVRSFDPASAVEDPALVLAFFGLVMAASVRLSVEGASSASAP